MQCKFLEKELLYDGTQLHSHFAFTEAGIEGDSIVCFIGGAEVDGLRLVDMEDRRKGDRIFSQLMLHTIIEHFTMDLELIIAFQRLFMGLACEELNMRLGKNVVSRTGDDLFYQQRKLSISIATRSPVSALIHAGFNIETTNTPIPTSGLNELEINPHEFGTAIMEQYVTEIDRMLRARWKVKAVP